LRSPIHPRLAPPPDTEPDPLPDGSPPRRPSTLGTSPPTIPYRVHKLFRDPAS
jgi:hypothetical protein